MPVQRKTDVKGHKIYRMNGLRGGEKDERGGRERTVFGISSFALG